MFSSDEGCGGGGGGCDGGVSLFGTTKVGCDTVVVGAVGCSLLDARGGLRGAWRFSIPVRCCRL